jgi:hypothetical protein
MTTLESMMERARDAPVPWDARRAAAVYEKTRRGRERLASRKKPTFVAIAVAASLGAIGLLAKVGHGLASDVSWSSGDRAESSVAARPMAPAWYSPLPSGSHADGGDESGTQ